MASGGFSVGPYDPCRCGSGKKYKFCCGKSGRAKYPLGTVAYYGPDDRTATKIAAGVFRTPDSEPILQRWVARDIARSEKVAQEIRDFFAKHGVSSVVVSDGIMGCPHEEGKDFAHGTDCPFCPFWSGRQGSAKRKSDSADDGPIPSTMVLGMAWYREEDYPTILQISDDRANMDDTYQTWLANAMRAKANMQQQGAIVKNVLVRPDELTQWCHTHGKPINGQARAEFVTDKLRSGRA